MKRLTFLIVTLLLMAFTAQSLLGEAMGITWEFERDPNEGAWTANKDVENLKMVGGLLVGNAVGDNAIITSPKFAFTPRFYDVVEMVMLTEKEGEARLSWSANLEEEDEGYIPANSVGFPTSTGFGRPLQVYPFWHTDEQIQQVRLHLPRGKFRMAFITIRNQREPISPARKIYDWQFTMGNCDWNVLQGEVVLMATPKGLPLQTTPHVMIASPTVRVSSELNKYVIIRMSVTAGKTATLGWVTNSRNGIRNLPFEIKADGQMHTYVLEVSESPGWSDQIRLLTLKPSDAPKADVLIESIVVAPTQQQPTEEKDNDTSAKKPD